jgi:hypothetical protein
MAHTIRFSDLIPANYNYELGKLYEGIARDYPLASMNLNLLKQAHADIQAALIARYGSLRAAPGDDVTSSIIYLLDRFTLWVNQKRLAGNEDAYVFHHSLDCRSQELFELLRELDNQS